MHDPALPSQDEQIAEYFGQTLEERLVSRRLFGQALTRYLEESYGPMGSANDAYVASLPRDRRPAPLTRT